MVRIRSTVVVISFLAVSAFAQGPICPTSNVTVTTTLTFDQTVDQLSDDIDKLHRCFNVEGCQLTEYSIGACGAAKQTRIAGPQKAATLVLKPGGCSKVFNCLGVYVTEEVYNTVRDHGCIPYDNDGVPVGVCAGVVVPSNVLLQITCAQCSGDWCHTCPSTAGCTATTNCDQSRRHLSAINPTLPCSTAKVSFTARNQTEAATIKKTLETGIVLKQLNYCLKDVNVTSAGPTVIGATMAT